ncbi:hypothetical protein LSCM4_03019 [Leishmania orientalis]|uniref:Uncharacterized protein n=1 Tax=Leishmania orientalis TaxID=2249476 RepID=A0A836GBJ3_9TRYP|nr:hypothetical protein LSCM4_03019 [Leishmania orientalis]
MPRIQLQSAHLFSTWLHNEIVTETPFGLSLRLRPVLTQALATTSRGGLVLVRPHVGHILASLTAEASAVLAAPANDDDGAAETLQGDAADVSRSLPGRVHSTNNQYAFLLQTLLRVARADESPHYHTGASFSPPSVRCAGAVRDGVGRKTVLYSAMLSHCAEWWDAGRGMRTTSACLYPRSVSMHRAVLLHRPFVFFDDVSEAAGRLADPSRLSGGGGGSRGARRRLLRALRLLSSHGGWQVCLLRPSRGDASSASATSSSVLLCQEEESVHVDWLDYLTERCVELDLRPAGDYDSFEPPLHGAASRVRPGGRSVADSTPITTAPARTSRCSCAGEEDGCVMFAMPDVLVSLSAVLWHILAAEVEGCVLHALHGLLQQYLSWPVLALPDHARAPLTRCRSDETAVLRHACHALQTLAHFPELAFACDSTGSDHGDAASSTSSALPPPVAGPVTLSCLIPNSVCLLPLARDGARSRFFLQGVPASVAPDGTVLRRYPLRVLLLRVDPEGDWLPLPEALASQRTLHASFDAQRGGPVDGGEGCEDGDSETSANFAVLEARGLGKRAVARGSAADGQRATSALPTSPPLSLDHSPTEDRVISMLTAHVTRRGPFAQAVASTRGLDQCVWLAAVRLFVYALLHGARVVVTPERLPTFVKAFGYRHVPQLHRRLCEVRRALRKAASDDGTLLSFTDPADVATRAAAITLLDVVCQREPPLAVYVVDRVFLSGFWKLQVGGNVSVVTSADCAVPTAPSSLPLLPVVLGRSVLRHPCSFDEACRSSRPSGICELAYCGVLGVEELCHVSARWQLQPFPCSAEEVMARCATAVASEDGDASRTHGGHVFVAALHSLLTLSSTDADDGVSRQSAGQNGDQGAGCGAGAGAWKAAADDSELRQPLLPSVLLVAPTRAQLVLYGELLRKAALALLEALSNPSASKADMPTSMRDAARTGHTSVQGLVRGGGAFFVSLARQARWLMQQLSVESAGADAGAALAAAGPVSSGPFASCGAVLWGIGVAPQDHAAVRFVLAILCEACAAMVTRLAEPLIERSAAAGHAVPQLRSFQASSMTRGPRARQRLWVEALRAAVTASSTGPAQPVLHVYHKSVDTVLSEAANGAAVDVCVDTQTVHGRAMEWFSSDLCLPSSPQPRVAEDAFVHRGGCGTKPSLSPWPFLEPLHTNARAVREALALVLHTLSATVS